MVLCGPHLEMVPRRPWHLLWHSGFVPPGKSSPPPPQQQRRWRSFRPRCYGILDLCRPHLDDDTTAGSAAAMAFWICASPIWTPRPPRPRRRASQVDDSGLVFYSWVCYYENNNNIYIQLGPLSYETFKTSSLREIHLLHLHVKHLKSEYKTG